MPVRERQTPGRKGVYTIKQQAIFGVGQDMTAETKKLLDEAMQLPAAERETLARMLFDSLEITDSNAETAWHVEIDRRNIELDQGDVKPIPWIEARRMIFGDPDDSGRDCYPSGFR
jgi:putative addiction module component (TIGR02574 family)